jgi:hypothetical protein
MNTHERMNEDLSTYTLMERLACLSEISSTLNNYCHVFTRQENLINVIELMKAQIQFELDKRDI